MSPDPLVPQTYALDYPSIEELLAILDANDDGTGGFLDLKLQQEMRIAGMENVDDLAMISEKILYLSTDIPPEKIQTIFFFGKEMIDAVHEKYRIDIEHIEECGRIGSGGRVEI